MLRRTYYFNEDYCFVARDLKQAIKMYLKVMYDDPWLRKTLYKDNLQLEKQFKKYGNENIDMHNCCEIEYPYIEIYKRPSFKGKSRFLGWTE